MRHFDGIESKIDCLFAAALSSHDPMAICNYRCNDGANSDLEERSKVPKILNLHIYDLRSEQSLAEGLYALIDAMRGMR